MAILYTILIVKTHTIGFIYYIGHIIWMKTETRDNDSHIYLYGLTVLSVLLQSFYQTEVERLNIISSLNPFELLYINAINTAPLLLALLAFTGQYRYAFMAEAWTNP